MRGILVYDIEGARRNEWFIAHLTECAKKRGHILELVIYPEQFEKIIHPLPDFAIVRTICPSLNLELESLGVPTFNNSTTSRIANDKWKTFLFGKELGLDVMHTEKISAQDGRVMPFPFVIKTVDGHGGSEVFLADSTDKCKEIFALLENKELISQELSSEPGIDMRVYMLGAEVIAAVKRSSASDFRSNFSLGGNAELVPLDEDVRCTAIRISTALRSDLVGIDFIRHKEKWILNEIEDVVGTRMLYSKTDLDAADMYIEYILNKLS